MRRLSNTNETLTITVLSPLLRPGLQISTCVSKHYAHRAALDLINISRAINGTDERGEATE